MKRSAAMIALGGMAITVLVLAACSKTKNSETASTPVSTCVRGVDGITRDQYGRTCANYPTNANSCVNTRYNPTTGQYVDAITGLPANCSANGYFDGYNSVPFNGLYGSQYINGCDGWSLYYNAQYVPVDLGNGQLICMNTAYLYQQVPTYNWNDYYQYQTPVYLCSGYDCGGSSYAYNGNAYSCGSNLTLGFNFGFLGGSYSTCGW